MTLRALRAASLLALAGFGGAVSRVQPPAAFRLPVEEVVLDNGMRVLLAPRPGVALVAAGWAVRAGSGDETVRTAGVAHLVEHLLHHGSARVSASDFARHYTEAGAVGIDARTDRDLSAYFLRIPADRLELWFWLESDRLLDPALDAVARELPIIAEERRQRLEATPTGAVDEELQRLLWGEHPYAWPAGGTTAALAALRPEDVQGWFAAHYGAGNLTAVLVGDFAPGRARELAHRYFGRVPAQRGIGPAPGATGSAAALLPLSRTADPATGRTVDRSCACPPQVRVLYPTVDVSHPDRPALDVLAGVLNGRTGRLYRSLVEGGLALSAAARSETRRRGGVFTVDLETRGQTTPQDLVVAWDGEVTRLLAEPPTAEELERVRNSVTTGAWRALREPLGFALRLMVADAQGDWRTIERWPADVRAVDAAAVQRVARQYLGADRRIVARLTREGR